MSIAYASLKTLLLHRWLEGWGILSMLKISKIIELGSVSSVCKRQRLRHVLSEYCRRQKNICFFQGWEFSCNISCLSSISLSRSFLSFFVVRIKNAKFRYNVTPPIVKHEFCLFSSLCSLSFNPFPT